MEMTQAYELTLNPTAASTDPLAICMEDLTKRTESTEILSFTSRLENASDPELEEKRLSFWLASIRKLALQMRQLSLYTEDKKPLPHQNFYEQPLRNNPQKQGGPPSRLVVLFAPINT